MPSDVTAVAEVLIFVHKNIPDFSFMVCRYWSSCLWSFALHFLREDNSLSFFFIYIYI